MNDGRKFALIVVYRPPEKSFHLFLEEFRTLLESVDTVSTNVLICGDFNYCTENSNTKEFKELMNVMQFENKVKVVSNDQS